MTASVLKQDQKKKEKKKASNERLFILTRTQNLGKSSL